MASYEDLIAITDFSPGIHQTRYESAIGSTRIGPIKPGAATVENTWRCIGHPDGSLGPAPRRVLSTALGSNFTNPLRGSSSLYPTGQVELYTADAIVDSAIFLDVNERAADDNVVFITNAWHYDRLSGSNYFVYVATTYYRLADNTVNDIYLGRTTSTPHTAASPPVTYPVSLLARAQTTHSAATVPYVADTIQPIIVHSAAFNRAAASFFFINSNTGMSAGDLALRRGTNQANYLSAAVDHNLMHWPNNSPAVGQGQSELVTTGNYVTLPGPSSKVGRVIKHLVTHQGSVVAVTQTPMYFGAATRFHHRELIVFCDPYKVFSSPGTNYIIPGEESSSGYGAVSSMNANDLVLVRHDGGALVIRGDLGFPQLQSLPMVEGTFGVECVPVNTPIGMVYLSRNGVFTWAGGDTSVKLSQQIDGDFTNYNPTIAPYGSRGRLAWWSPFILVPNNFMFDTRTGSWWKLDRDADHPVYNCYDTDAQGRLYAFRHKTTQTETVPFDRYDQATLASDWSWQSQVLTEPERDRWQSISRISLVTERATGGTPSITVTITGLDENGNTTSTGTAVFSLSSNNVNGQSTQLRDLNRNVKGQAIQVRIEASSGDPTIAAPLVRGLTIARRTDHRTVKEL